MNLLIGYFLLIINSSNNKDMNYIIAKYIIEHYSKLHTLTLQDIADGCYVSMPTVKKFFHQFGHTNFLIVKEQMEKEKDIRLAQMKRNYETFEKTDLQRSIYKLSTCETPELFYQSVQLQNILSIIHASKRIIIIGSCSFTQLLFNFQLDMYIMGKPVLISSQIKENMIDFEKDDVVILISGSGRTLYAEELIATLQNIVSPIVIVTSDVGESYAFPIAEKLQLWIHNEMFNAEYIVLYYFDYLRREYYEQYGKKVS